MRVTTEQFGARTCGCRSAGECTHNAFAWKKALDKCVDLFAAEMKSKLTHKALEGKSGWDKPDWKAEDAWFQLLVHVLKGDPVDIANFAMFLWNMGAYGLPAHLNFTDIGARVADPPQPTDQEEKKQ